MTESSNIGLGFARLIFSGLWVQSLLTLSGWCVDHIAVALERARTFINPLVFLHRAGKRRVERIATRCTGSFTPKRLWTPATELHSSHLTGVISYSGYSVSKYRDHYKRDRHWHPRYYLVVSSPPTPL